MSLNLVIPNKDNKVVFIFGGLDLTLATNIVVKFGTETYQLADPQVTVTSATELTLDLSATSQVGRIFATVTYFDGGSVNGTDITSQEIGNLSQIIVAIGTQLIIEDGSVVANANSFVTDAELKAFAALNNYPLPATQPDREALLSKAYLYITSTYEYRLQGYRVSENQTGMFPRRGVYAYNFLVGDTAIPQGVKQAQISAALSVNEGVDINAVKSDPDLASFTVVGVYSETYQSSANTPTIPEMPAVSKYLRPYMKSSGGISAVREEFGYLY